jgi:mono/diheme cytochrome c family protein
VTEVPEHLLARSRARRAALGLGGGDDAGATAPAAEATTAVEATGEVAAPAAAAAAVPAEVEKPPPPPPPPYVQAALARKRIPVWAMPVLGLLPLWAVLYAGSLSEADTGELTQLDEGAVIYEDSGCAGCHGASGGGGVGPAFSDGAVLETFPAVEQQIAWVAGGSDSAVGGVYGANGKESKGGMPAFGGTLTEEEILAVVRHERETLSGAEVDPALLDAEGHLLHENGEPWLDDEGHLVDDAGERLFDDEGNYVLVEGGAAQAEAEGQGSEPTPVVED